MIGIRRCAERVGREYAARPASLTVVTLLLVMLLAVSRAHAGGSDDQGRAQDLQAAGLTSMQAGNYLEALARFEQAMSLAPSPKIAFNMGKAHLALGNDLEALEAFDRFLAEAPGAPKSSRDEARKAVEALRSRLASIEIQSEDAGATVLIDGYQVGTVPLPRPKVVKPGPHEIYVSLHGLKAYAKTIVAGAGQKTRVPVKLEAIPRPPVAIAPAPASPPPPPRPRIIETTPPEPGAGRQPPPPDRDLADGHGGAGRQWAKPAALVAGGLGVLLMGGGVAAQLESASKYRQFNAVPNPLAPSKGRCAQTAADRGGGPCAGLYRDGQRFQTLAIVGFAAGGAALAGALVFTLIAPHSSDGRERQVAAACAPAGAAGGGDGGLSCALSLHY
jgi:hypothetical protein